MRFMVLLKATEKSEAGVMPSEAEISDMEKFIQEQARAGVLLDAGGLTPSSEGARVTFAGGKSHVIDGPFTETKELIAGYWLIDVKSKEEAIAWIRRAPNFGGPNGEVTVEIRRMFEMEESGEGATREVGKT